MKKTFGLRSRFLRMFFVTTAILLLSIFIILNLVLFHNEKTQYDLNAESRVDSLSGLIDRDYNSALDASNNVVNSQIVIDILKDGKGNMEDVFEDYALLEKFFKSFTTYEKNASNKFWIYPENSAFPEGAYISKLSKLKKSDIWQELSDANDNDAVWDYTENEESYISLYRRIANYGEPLGYLEIRLPLKHTVNTIKEAQLLDGEQITYKIPDGREIYKSDKSERTKSAYRYMRTLVNGDSIMLCVERHNVLKNYYFYTAVFAVTFFVIILAIYFIYKYIVSYITKDLQEFINLLGEEDNVLLNADFSCAGSDRDIMKIKEKFRDLILKINRMHEDIKKINKEKKKVELEFLQMSFNPHMLYNSLSSIKWRLYNSGDEEMSELIERMTAYYRAVLSGGENIITIREEIDLIKQYLKIVEMSYNTKINLCVEMNENLDDGFVIKQLLQPIVENAVMHGINGMGNAQIKITIKREANDIIFIVANNGCAISEEAIRYALGQEKTSSAPRGYGIRNTINRIKTYYGNEYGLDIIGKGDEGTEVIIRIEYLDKEVLKERM